VVMIFKGAAPASTLNLGETGDRRDVF